MIKSIFAATAAIAASAGTAFAGPYVNVEANAGWTGSNYTGTSTDAHIGYEGEFDAATYYVQGGFTLVSPDGGESDTVPSGKAGISAPVTEELAAYGEVSFQGSGDDDIDRGYGVKVGATYAF